MYSAVKWLRNSFQKRKTQTGWWMIKLFPVIDKYLTNKMFVTCESGHHWWVGRGAGEYVIIGRILDKNLEN